MGPVGDFLEFNKALLSKTMVNKPSKRPYFWGGFEKVREGGVA